MRITRFVAETGAASRRKADLMVQEGRVTVNGQVVREPWRDINPQSDEVMLDGRVLQASPHLCVLLNKPAGCLSSASDDRGRTTVVDLVREWLGSRAHNDRQPAVPREDLRLYPVGRLDYDTEGLLLLTNDGELANLLMHPRYGVEKTYHAMVAGVPEESALDMLRQGIELEDGRTAPARVRRLERSDQPGRSRGSYRHGHVPYPESPDRESSIPVAGCTLELVIHEGRKRQVKRMCAAIGHPVLKLVRAGYAFLELGDLPAGQCRLLTGDEIERLRKISAPKK